MTKTDKQFWGEYRDPRWQKRRLEILDRSGWKCEACEAEDRQLHVHHRRYERGRKPWEYDDEVFQALCDTCHERITKAHKIIARYKELPIYAVETLAGHVLYALMMERLIEEAEFPSFEIEEGFWDSIPDFYEVHREDFDGAMTKHLVTRVALDRVISLCVKRRDKQLSQKGGEEDGSGAH